MQQRKPVLVLLALLVAGPSLSAASEGTSALNVAYAWLNRRAASPLQGDQLEELKSANPQAYAIVKALLAKRSAGLLDPHHPNHALANPSEQTQDPSSSSEEGPQVFAKFASQSPSAPVQDIYPEASTHAQHDWLNWKPQSSAMADDAMVQNVLGAVAGLSNKKAGFMKKRSVVEESSETAEAVTAEAAVRPVVPEVQTLTAHHHGNAYLKDIDFTAEMPRSKPRVVSASASPLVAKASNTYLKGIDLSGDMPQSISSLSALSGSTSSMVPEVPKVAQPHHANAYLKDIDLSGTMPQSNDLPSQSSESVAPLESPKLQEAAEGHQTNAYTKSAESYDSPAGLEGITPLVEDSHVQEATEHAYAPSNDYLQGLDLSAGVPLPDDFDLAKETKVQKVVVEEPTSQGAMRPHHVNSYLKDLDLNEEGPKEVPSDHHGNYYLDGLDLVAKHTQTNYLASFNWDDAPPAPAPKRPEHQMRRTSRSQRVIDGLRGGQSSLLSWLSS